MLRIICLSCLLVALSTQSETPKYLDGGLRYLTKKINEKNSIPRVSRNNPSNHISQPPNSDLEAIPESKPTNSPALQMIPFKSHDPFIVTPSYYPAIKTITSSPKPDIPQSSTRTSETITVSESIKAPALKMIPVVFKEPAVVSTLFPSVVTFDAFPINKEIPIAVSNSNPRHPGVAYQVLEQQVTSAPILEVSTEARRCPFVKTTEQETSSSTATATTMLPTLQISTTPTTAIRVTSPSLQSCINGEIYPTDTGSCDQFLMCHNSVVVLLICPQGMGFNFETQRCDWLQYVPACKAQGN